MIITTKFDIDQTVWFMKDNKPCSAVVKGLRAFRLVAASETEYDLQGLSGFHDESDLFPSKAALLESL